MAIVESCFSCGGKRVETFYELLGVTVQSTALLDTEKEALDFTTGDIALAVCTSCGFIFNAAFEDPGVSAIYEDQQGFSPTFSSFAGRLARRLVDKYDLRGKRTLEIGCGKGDFLALLCQAGILRGVGIDPLCEPDRIDASLRDRLTLIKETFSEEHGVHAGELVACRHTLEHIADVRSFLSTVRTAIDTQTPIVFFEVPDVSSVLGEVAFWDVYYEHCSYFSPGSLARLFRHCGLDVLDVYRDYDDQYLMIDARPQAAASSMRPHPIEEEPKDIVDSAHRFTDRVGQRVTRWKQLLGESSGPRTQPAIWGSGSKCVSFLATLGLENDVDCVVDINPYRQGRYMPGFRAPIRSPEYLKEYRPETIIVMNPIYEREIIDSVRSMDLDATVMSVSAVS